MKLNLFGASNQQQLTAKFLIEQVGQLREPLRRPAPCGAITAAAWMHGDNGMGNITCCGLTIEKYTRLSPFLFCDGDREPSVLYPCAHRYCYSHGVLGLVHGPEAIVTYLDVEKPAVPIVQPHTPARARRTHQHLVFNTSEG